MAPRSLGKTFLGCKLTRGWRRLASQRDGEKIDNYKFFLIKCYKKREVRSIVKKKPIEYLVKLRGQWKLCLEHSQILPYASFLLVGSHLYPFAIRKL